MFICNLSYANDNIEINLPNGSNIDKQTIYSILDELPDILTDDDLNYIIKRLRTIESISDVIILKENEKIIINIKQNKIINSIKFTGNKRFKDDEINSILPFDNYLQFFDEQLIEEFIEELKELYFSYAYNKVSIIYNIIENKYNNNFIDLTFDIDEGKISKVNKIFFSGNDSFKKNTLLDNIKSKEKNYLRLQRGNNFKQYVVNNDAIRLKQFYLNNGYRNVSIATKTEFVELKNKFNIYFFVTEGPIFNFGKLNIDIKLKYIDENKSNKILNYFNSLINDAFKNKKNYNYSFIKSLDDKIHDYIFSLGFNFIKIQVDEDIDNNIVNLNFIIFDDNPKYAKQINIYGNKRTLDKTIRRVVPFAEGDSFTSRDIAIIKSNLNRLNFFKNIVITENKIDDDYAIDINIDEKPTGDFQIGVAFGTLNGSSLITKLSERNIGGTGRDLQFIVNNSEDNARYKLSSKEPFAFNKPIDLIYGVEYVEKNFSKSNSYKVNTLKFDSGVSLDILDKLKYNISLIYELKDYRITNESTVSKSILNSSGKNAVVSLVNSLAYSDLDSFIMPSNGSSINYLNVISPPTSSNGAFIKNEVTYKKFIPIKKDIFSIQTRLGNIFSYEGKEILNDNKYSLGGFWLRGFDSFGAGPRNSYTSYQGGNNLIVSKFDYSKPLNKNSDNPLYFNVFSDVGKVWSNKNNPSNSKESIRSSVGYGIKWYSPIGPFGVSWAFPIEEESYDIKRSFLFSIGNIN